MEIDKYMIGLFVIKDEEFKIYLVTEPDYIEFGAHVDLSAARTFATIHEAEDFWDVAKDKIIDSLKDAHIISARVMNTVQLYDNIFLDIS